MKRLYLFCKIAYPAARVGHKSADQAKERNKIEAKNSELKHEHWYDVATSSALLGMKMQRGNDHIRCKSQADIEVNNLRIPERELNKTEKRHPYLKKWGWIPFYLKIS